MILNSPAATTAFGKDESRCPEFHHQCTGRLLRSYGGLLRFSSPQPGPRQRGPQPKRAAGSGRAAAGEPRTSRAAASSERPRSPAQPSHRDSGSDPGPGSVTGEAPTWGERSAGAAAGPSSRRPGRHQPAGGEESGAEQPRNRSSPARGVPAGPPLAAGGACGTASDTRVGPHHGHATAPGAAAPPGRCPCPCPCPRPAARSGSPSDDPTARTRLPPLAAGLSFLFYKPRAVTSVVFGRVMQALLSVSGCIHLRLGGQVT